MYRGTKVLDIHGHMSAPNAIANYAMMQIASNTSRPNPLEALTTDNELDKFVRAREVEGITDADFLRTNTAHVKLLDDRQIDCQVLGPRPYMTMGWMEPHLIPTWTRFQNDCIHKQVTNFPTRFAGAVQLPMISEAPDTKHVLPELERCVKELGFVATYASPDPGGKRTTPGMHEPYWYDLYAKCQELDIPVIVHGTNCLDRRFRGVPHNYQLGFLTEQYLANQFLQHSDVFKRFPKLKIVICHCGGALDRFLKNDPHLTQEDLSENLFYDTCAYDLDFLTAAIKQRTPKRMLFGTEVPGSGRALRDNGRPGDDLVPVISAMDFLTDEDRLTMFNRNILKVVPRLAKRLAEQDKTAAKAAA